MSISWTLEDYPFLSAVGEAGVIAMQRGVQANVPADGSSFPTVTFPSPFSSLPVVVGDPNTTSASAQQLSVDFFNIAANTSGQYVTFQISVTGGQPGSTVNIGWIATNGD